MPVGNIRLMLHKIGDAETADWKRAYDYSPNDRDPPETQVSNRLRATSVSGDDINDPITYSNLYEHDAHGNMTAMPHIDALTSDEDDRLQSTNRSTDGSGITYYVNDGAGQRVRKVHVKNSTREQRLYFGAWELYREEHNINTTPVLDLERATLHVHDDTGRICLAQMQKNAKHTGKTTVAYVPMLPDQAVRQIRKAGFLVFRTRKTLFNSFVSTPSLLKAGETCSSLLTRTLIP